MQRWLLKQAMQFPRLHGTNAHLERLSKQELEHTNERGSMEHKMLLPWWGWQAIGQLRAIKDRAL